VLTTKDASGDTTLDEVNKDVEQSNAAGDQSCLLKNQVKADSKEPRATGKGIRKSRKKKEPLVDVID